MNVHLTHTVKYSGAEQKRTKYHKCIKIPCIFIYNKIMMLEVLNSLFFLFSKPWFASVDGVLMRS